MSQLVDLVWSAVALFVFWVAGAAMFHAIEGWSFGDAVYAMVILTLTIGQSLAASSSRLSFVELLCQPSADPVPERFQGFRSDRACWADGMDPVHASGRPHSHPFAVQIITGLVSAIQRPRNFLVYSFTCPFPARESALEINSDTGESYPLTRGALP
jgi:hypothetical protein